MLRDDLATHVEGIRAAVERVGPGSVAAVVTTTSALHQGGWVMALRTGLSSIVTGECCANCKL